MKKFSIFMFLLSSSLLLNASELFFNKLDTDSLLALNNKEHFSANGDKIQISADNATLTAAWATHKLKVSEKNLITFNLKSLDNKTPLVYLHVTIYPYHADSADQCNGKATAKTLAVQTKALPESKEIKLNLPISANDLICIQCGKTLNHGTFLFNFNLREAGNIEISPFNITTSFPIYIQTKNDEHASYLANLFREDYTPYPDKKLSDKAVLTDTVLTLSQKALATRKNLTAFRPVLENYQNGKIPEAIALAEKLDNDNTFASIFLYLIYSRGYDGIEINNQKAGKYFSNLIGSYYMKEPGFMFYIFEYHNVWKKYRLTPTVPDEKVTIKAWDNRGSVMDEIVPLRGQYPLKNCYEEEMQNLGGVGARTLYLVAREQFALAEIRQEARKLNSAEAIIGVENTPFEFRGMQQERISLEKEGVSFTHPSETEFKNLEKASFLGYVPAKLKLARTLVTDNYKHAEFDAVKARKLLMEVIKDCQKYESIGCRHALTDLKYAKDLLAIIPDPNTDSAELERRYYNLLKLKAEAFDHNFINFQISIIKNLLDNRNDNPESLFFQADKIPNNQWQKKHEAMFKAAEAGSKQAISYCLSMLNRYDKKYCKVLVLAGKNQIPYNGSFGNFYQEAYQKLQELRFQLMPADYKEILGYIAPYHSQAQEELKVLSESENLKFEFISDNLNSIKCQFLPNDGRPTIKITAAAADIERHITIKCRSGKLKGSLFFVSRSQETSNLALFGEFQNENGQNVKIYTGNFVPMKFIPEELKITIAPRKTALDLDINVMLQR